MYKKILLTLIILLSAVLRLTGLNYNPPSLNWDEISHGYNAYSILKTGEDEWGIKYPLANFRAYGDYPLPLTMYLTIPFIALFNLSEFSIRLPHAIAGVATVVCIFFLVKKYKDDNHALLAGFLAAITPWYLFGSRAVFQSNISILLLILGATFLIWRSKNKWLLPLSFLFFGLSLFSYHSTRIFAPLLVLVIAFIWKKEVLRSKLTIGIILLFFLPLPFILLNSEARARSEYVFVLNQGAINEINDKRTSSTLPSIITKILYNKPLYIIEKSLDNYVDYFSPKYLFIKGGTQYQFSVPNRGVLYFVSMPFFYIGLLVLFKNALQKDKYAQFFLLWLLMAPIPAAITSEKYAVIRSTTILPLPEILISLGFFYALNKIKENKEIIITAFIFLLLLSLGNYLKEYFGSYRSNYSWAWQYGYKEVVEFIIKNESNYDKIVITKKYGEPHEFLLFYSKFDPILYKNDPNLIRFLQSNWFWVDRFNKYYFVNDWNIKDREFIMPLEKEGIVDCTSAKCLLITSPGKDLSNWNFKNDIKFLDNKVAFEIYDNIK